MMKINDVSRVRVGENLSPHKHTFSGIEITNQGSKKRIESLSKENKQYIKDCLTDFIEELTY